MLLVPHRVLSRLGFIPTARVLAAIRIRLVVRAIAAVSFGGLVMVADPWIPVLLLAFHKCFSSRDTQVI